MPAMTCSTVGWGRESSGRMRILMYEPGQQSARADDAAWARIKER
jgi:hypothetical protein